MSPNTKNIAYALPISGAALDAIKLIAAALMVIDHIDDMIFERTMLAMGLIGRIVFPLFCFATVAAILRSGPEKAYSYAAKILVLAIIVEPISQVARDNGTANILFTLGIGAILIPYVLGWSHRTRILVFTLGLVSILFENQWEYGVLGAMIPSVMYLTMIKGEKYLPWLIVMLAAVNFGNLTNFLVILNPEMVMFMIMTIVMTTLAPLMVVSMCKGFQSKVRLMPKYFLHIFYPAHLVVIAICGAFI